MEVNFNYFIGPARQVSLVVSSGSGRTCRALTKRKVSLGELFISPTNKVPKTISPTETGGSKHSPRNHLTSQKSDEEIDQQHAAAQQSRGAGNRR